MCIVFLEVGVIVQDTLWAEEHVIETGTLSLYKSSLRMVSISDSICPQKC